LSTTAPAPVDREASAVAWLASGMQLTEIELPRVRANKDDVSALTAPALVSQGNAAVAAAARARGLLWTTANAEAFLTSAAATAKTFNELGSGTFGAAKKHIRSQVGPLPASTTMAQAQASLLPPAPPQPEYKQPLPEPIPCAAQHMRPVTDTALPAPKRKRDSGAADVAAVGIRKRAFLFANGTGTAVQVNPKRGDKYDAELFKQPGCGLHRDRGKDASERPAQSAEDMTHVTVRRLGGAFSRAIGALGTLAGVATAGTEAIALKYVVRQGGWG
jgi:hypothetical protein